MGRTNPTYRDFLRRYEDRWAPFRRALRRRYREDFDRLFDAAARHADAAGHANARDPESAALLSVLLAHETDRRELEARVAAIERELGIEGDEAGNDAAGFSRAGDVARPGDAEGPDDRAGAADGGPPDPDGAD